MDVKRQLMELIDNMPPHEGMTFEEALAEHLIANGVTVPVRCMNCKNWGPVFENNPLFKGCAPCLEGGRVGRIKKPEEFCSRGKPKEE